MIALSCAHGARSRCRWRRTRLGRRKSSTRTSARVVPARRPPRPRAGSQCLPDSRGTAHDAPVRSRGGLRGAPGMECVGADAGSHDAPIGRFRRRCCRPAAGASTSTQAPPREGGRAASTVRVKYPTSHRRRRRSATSSRAAGGAEQAQAAQLPRAASSPSAAATGEGDARRRSSPRAVRATDRYLRDASEICRASQDDEELRGAAARTTRRRARAYAEATTSTAFTAVGARIHRVHAARRLLAQPRGRRGVSAPSDGWQERAVPASVLQLPERAS